MIDDCDPSPRYFHAATQHRQPSAVMSSEQNKISVGNYKKKLVTAIFGAILIWIIILLDMYEVWRINQVLGVNQKLETNGSAATSNLSETQQQQQITKKATFTKLNSSTSKSLLHLSDRIRSTSPFAHDNCMHFPLNLSVWNNILKEGARGEVNQTMWIVCACASFLEICNLTNCPIKAKNMQEIATLRASLVRYVQLHRIALNGSVTEANWNNSNVRLTWSESYKLLQVLQYRYL